MVTAMAMAMAIATATAIARQIATIVEIRSAVESAKKTAVVSGGGGHRERG